MTGNTTSDSGALIIQVENHCRKLFAQFDQGEMIYHNIRHTELVVDRCEEMARYYHLTGMGTVCFDHCCLVPRHGAIAGGWNGA